MGMPIIKTAVRGAITAVLGPKIGLDAASAVGDAASDRIEERVVTDPAFRNQVNLEPIAMSRVANYGSVAFLLGCVLLWDKLQRGEFDQEFAITLAAVISTLMAVLGRVLNWSKPMWSRLAGWLGRFSGWLSRRR